VSSCVHSPEGTWQERLPAGQPNVALRGPCVKKSRFREYFLANLGTQSYAVVQKAHAFAWIAVIILPLLAIPTVLNLTLNVSAQPVLISTANLVFMAAIICGLALLRGGRYNAAVGFVSLFIALRVVFGAFIKMDYWIATGSNNDVYFMYAALAFAALFAQRRVQIAIGLIFIVFIAVSTAWMRGTVDPRLFGLMVGTSINAVIGIILVVSLSCMITAITGRSLRFAERELKRNRDLAEELERQVEELEAMNEEMEAMNEDLTATHGELVESNRSLKVFRDFAEASGQGLAMFRTGGALLYVNRAFCRLVGEAGPGFMQGRDVTDYYPDEWKAPAAAVIFPAVMSGGQWVGELPLAARDGTVIPAIQNLFLVSDEADEFLCIAAVITDLSDRKRLEARLLQAGKMEAVGRLAGGIAHDFNNLLTAILGFGELLLADLPSGDRRREYAEEILRAGKMSTDIVRQLLAFSKRQVLKPAAIDLNREIVSLRGIIGRFTGDDIELELDLDPQGPIVVADPAQIEQVIVNLVINACDAMPSGGRLTLQTRTAIMDPAEPNAGEGRAVAIMTILDTGSGISTESMPRIFEPFFSTKKPEEGTGLGLSVVYGIIEQHGGWITVNSEPGAGSAFAVHLPLAGEHPGITHVTLPSLDLFRGAGERVLLVEDQDKVRAFTSTLLREYNYTVLEAEDAHKAMAIFDREGGDVSLVLADIILPKKSGIELIEELTQKKKNLRVILTSGYADLDHKAEALNDLDYPFLQKPYSVLDLLRTVHLALGKNIGRH
jgi:PAS domain S-box-containing protein